MALLLDFVAAEHATVNMGGVEYNGHWSWIYSSPVKMDIYISKGGWGVQERHLEALVSRLRTCYDGHT